tara:strand:- start:148 stop:387 length:240 start_codon:yes stop_codon:yes gene_type:complete
MKKSTFFSILISLTLVLWSCEEKNVPFKTFYENGQLKTEQLYDINGQLIEESLYNKNGQLEVKTSYHGDGTETITSYNN